MNTEPVSIRTLLTAENAAIAISALRQAPSAADSSDCGEAGEAGRCIYDCLAMAPPDFAGRRRLTAIMPVLMENVAGDVEAVVKTKGR